MMRRDIGKDRFYKYGKSLKGVGDEGLSEEQNQKMYAQAASVFQGILQRGGIDLQKAKVLEIGCGTGFFTGILNELGVNDYTGLDITDVLFDDLKRKFPHYKFILRDITQAILPDKYDLIIMIDVLEHIVDESKFNFAMDSIRQVLTDNGIFLAGPLLKKRQNIYFMSTFGPSMMFAGSFLFSLPLTQYHLEMVLLYACKIKNENPLRNSYHRELQFPFKL